MTDIFRLDPRFETTAASSGLSAQELDTEVYGSWPQHLHPRGPYHRAFVLLQPGSALPTDLFAGRAIQMNESVFIIEADLDTLRRLSIHPAVVYIEAPRPIGEDLDKSVPATRADAVAAPSSGAPGQTGRGVVVGIIDTGGIDWKLEDFQANKRTRIRAIWDQSLQPVAAEKSPAPYGYGVEYEQTDINNDLAGHATIRHRCKAGSHGTHVTGIAAGNGSATGPNPAGGSFAAGQYKGVATDAEIIYVEAMKNPGTALSSSDRIAEAIKYIFEKAGTCPCVVNVSLGNNGGAHDGESVVERTIDRMLEARGRVLVKSAGNEANWDCHASVTLTAEAPRCTLEWQFGRQGRSDRTPNELEIWYSSRDRLEIRVEDTSGNLTPHIMPRSYHSQSWQLGTEQVTISSERFHPLNGASYVHIYVGSATANPLTSGVWKVMIKAYDPKQIKDGRIDAWIERDRRDQANLFADQSFFRTYVTADGTLSPPGTIRRGLTAGNYDHHSSGGVGASSSGHGPTRDGRSKPDLAAPGQKVWSSGALGNQANAAGTIFPVRVEKTGTSMSAPHVTGICAQLLQANPTMTSAQIGAALVATTSSIGASASFDPQLGFGRIDAKEADTALR
jgi:subtilisin family serine protease